MKTKIPEDGYRWLSDIISNPYSWSLVDPNGHPIAHVYRCNDKTVAAVWHHGQLIADGFTRTGPALRAVEDLARPCAYRHDLPDGHCDNDREPGSPYCPPHRAGIDRQQHISDDMDRLTGGAR